MLHCNTLKLHNARYTCTYSFLSLFFSFFPFYTSIRRLEQIAQYADRLVAILRDHSRARHGPLPLHHEPLYFSIFPFLRIYLARSFSSERKWNDAMRHREVQCQLICYYRDLFLRQHSLHPSITGTRGRFLLTSISLCLQCAPVR